MKTNSNILIVYKKHISANSFDEIKNNLRASNIEFKAVTEETEYDNFIGPEISDVIVFIKDTIISGAVYDLIKTSIVSIWDTLKSANSKGSKKMRIEYTDVKNRTIKINVDENFNKENAAYIIGEAIKVLKETENEKIFNEPDFVHSDDFETTIEMNFNPISNSWEPTNFSEMRKRWEDLEKEAEEKFSD